MRILAVLVLAALVGGALLGAGCGAGGPRRERGRLLVWTSHNNEEVAVFKRLVARFEARFQEEHGRPVHVEVGRVAHEGLETKLKSAALSRTTPDICRLDVAHVATLAWGSAAVRLDTAGHPFFADRDKVRAHFLEAALASNLVPVPDGKGGFETGLYGVPEQTNCLVLFRNRALFRRRTAELTAAGLDPERAPATWEELVAYGRVLAEPEQGFQAFGMKNTLWWSLPFLFSGGGTIFESDPARVYTCALAAPPARAAYQYWVDLSRRSWPGPAGEVTVEGGFWRGEADEQKAFMEGRLAMSMSGPWSVPLYRTRLPELTVSPIPAGPAGSVSTVGGSNLVVLPTCVDREAALAFLAFVGSDEYQLEWAEELGQIPVTRKALDEASQKADSILRVFMEQMRTARARPTLPNFQPVENIFQAEMELALRGNHTVEESLARVAAQVEAEVLQPLRDAL